MIQLTPHSSETSYASRAKASVLLPRPKTPPFEPSEADEFLEEFGLDSLPTIPTTSRPIKVLLEPDDIWSMSTTERSRLSKHLSRVARPIDRNTQAEKDFWGILRQYDVFNEQYKTARDQVSSGSYSI